LGEGQHGETKERQPHAILAEDAADRRADDKTESESRAN